MLIMDGISEYGLSLRAKNNLLHFYKCDLKIKLLLGLIPKNFAQGIVSIETIPCAKFLGINPNNNLIFKSHL